jgi:hypothetical protein
MNARQDQRTSGKPNAEALARAIRENVSPDGVAMAIADLRSAELGNRPTSARALATLREVEWLADTLTEMLGAEERNRLMDELGL